MYSRRLIHLREQAFHFTVPGILLVTHRLESSQSSQLGELRSVQTPVRIAPCEAFFGPNRTPKSITPWSGSPLMRGQILSTHTFPALSFRLVFSSGILLDLSSRTFSSQFLFRPPAHLVFRRRDSASCYGVHATPDVSILVGHRWLPRLVWTRQCPRV
jgi:hypothetical protein